MKRIQHFTHEQLIKLIDQVPGMVYQFKLDTNDKLGFTFVSKGILYYGGTLDDLDASFNQIINLLNPSEYKRFVDSILHSAQHLSEWNEEFRYHHPERGPSWIKGRSFPEKQQDGSIIWNGYLTDITQEKMLELTLKQAIEVRDAFISIASHELKTPMTVLLMQLQMIKRKYQDVDGLTMDVNKAITQIDRLTRQINNFFDSRDVQHEESYYENDSYNFSQFIESYLESNFSEYLQDEMRIKLKLDKGIFTRLSKDKLSQIMNNLISNSLKYAPQSQIVISLKKHKDCIELCIGDDGPGIPESLLPNIFSRYQKSGNEFNISGIGLGLFVTKKLADLFKARIDLKTGPNKGTTVRVQFPLEIFLFETIEKIDR